MDQTPGEHLAQVLKARNIKLTAFARRVGRSFQTVWNWTRDLGFGEEQRALAAEKLGESADFFSQPDLALQRENYRQMVLAKFRSHKVGRTLTKDEWRSLESFRWPEEVAPSESRYWGLVLVIRGQLSPAEFDATVEAVEQAVEPHLQRKSSPATPKGTSDTAEKKAKKRQKPQRPHK